MITSEEIRAKIGALGKRDDRERLSIEGFRQAGVLVPIILDTVTPELLFTKRTELVETHKGQISFPGGMTNPEDEDVVRTALREAEEEIGIPGSAVEIVGTLDDLPTPTGFVITPVVGVIKKLPRLSPNRDEVADIFQVPLSFFVDSRNGRAEIREFRGVRREIWFYQRGEHSIWGATAMIVRSLLKNLDLV